MRFWQEFNRIEWLGNDESDLLADPHSIQVVLHNQNHQVYMEGEPIRASAGRFYVDFDLDALTPGSYAISWRFEPIHGVVQIKRQEFLHHKKWSHNVDGYCLVYGNEYDATGVPLHRKRVTIVQYEDLASKDRILSSLDEFTDAQGAWSATLKHGDIYQIIKDNRKSKVFRVPEKSKVDFDDIEPYNNSIVNVDKFGNPIDGTLHQSINSLYLGNRQNKHY